jgi:gas vesicle protein
MNMPTATQSKAINRTKLGELAQQIVTKTHAATLSVASISGYVYALRNASAPQVNFKDVPPGMQNSQLALLQSAYDTFQTQFATFQGQAGNWINTSGTGGSSIFSQLVSIPTTLALIKDAVSSDFSVLHALKPGTESYEKELKNLEALIQAQSNPITSLNKAMHRLGTELQQSADSLVASTKTGVLLQMQNAYSEDIQKIKDSIQQCNNKLSKDKKKLAADGVGLAASLAVGIIGLLSYWTPFGIVALGAGITGSVITAEKIGTLEGEVTNLKRQITVDTFYQNEDVLAAQLMVAFSDQLEGFAALNQSAQKELASLESLYANLSHDIADAVADLTDNELAEAQHEWQTILSEAAYLANLTAYIWPPSTLLSNPSSFAAIENDIFAISVSGEMFHYSGSRETWSTMDIKALSCVGSGEILAVISGEPVNGSSTSSTNTSSYFVKSYNLSTSQWSTISDFPAACVAVGNNQIYAINQTVSDRQVYKYNGSGTSWTKLPNLPGPDAAIQIAVAGGTVFALTCNSQLLYQFDSNSNSWQQITAQGVESNTFAFITSNGNKLAMVQSNHYAWLYDPAIGMLTGGSTGNGIISIAQLRDGNQFWTNLLPEVNNMQFANTNVNPIQYNGLGKRATCIFTSDTDLMYFTDYEGDMYRITSSGVATKLPLMPNV